MVTLILDKSIGTPEYAIIAFNLTHNAPFPFHPIQWLKLQQGMAEGVAWKGMLKAIVHQTKSV